MVVCMSAPEAAVTATEALPGRAAVAPPPPQPTEPSRVAEMVAIAITEKSTAPSFFRFSLRPTTIPKRPKPEIAIHMADIERGP